MSKYEVKSVVCDYGVFEDNELKLICNSHANALKIKEILDTDSDMSKPYVWQDRKIADLEAKLAEKAEQVKQLKLDLGMYKSVNEFINSYGIEKAREVLLQTEKTNKQDKISFAVEKLQEAKRLLEEKYTYDVAESDFAVIYEDDVDEIIDNQIKQLKEGE